MYLSSALGSIFNCFVSLKYINPYAKRREARFKQAEHDRFHRLALEEERKARLNEEILHPKPAPRRRRLTLPLSPEISDGLGETYIQAQSPLMRKLPLEVRRLIYTEVISSRTFHVWSRWSDDEHVMLGSVSCHLTGVEWFFHNRCWPSLSYAENERWFLQDHMASLLLTCREMFVLTLLLLVLLLLPNNL